MGGLSSDCVVVSLFTVDAMRDYIRPEQFMSPNLLLVEAATIAGMELWGGKQGRGKSFFLAALGFALLN